MLEIPSHHKQVTMNMTTDMKELELEQDQSCAALAMTAVLMDKSGHYGSMQTRLSVASLTKYFNKRKALHSAVARLKRRFAAQI